MPSDNALLDLTYGACPGTMKALSILKKVKILVFFFFSFLWDHLCIFFFTKKYRIKTEAFGLDDLIVECDPRALELMHS